MKTKFNEKNNTIMIQCVKHARKSPIWVDLKDIDIIQHKTYMEGPSVYLKNENQSFIQIKDFYIGDYDILLDMINLFDLDIDNKMIHGRWWIKFKTNN